MTLLHFKVLKANSHQSNSNTFNKKPPKKIHKNIYKNLNNKWLGRKKMARSSG